MERTKVQELIENLKKRNITGVYCSNLEDALNSILQLIPKDVVVGIGNSRTLKDMNLTNVLTQRGNTVLDKTIPDLTPEIKVNIKRQALLSDYYVSGTNALSMQGHIVNIDHSGNRVAAMIYGPRKVIVVIGTNKIATTLDEAISRARNVAAPKNAARAGYNPPCRTIGHCVDCDSAERVCFNLTVIEGQVDPSRMTVILVDEKLGF